MIIPKRDKLHSFASDLLQVNALLRSFLTWENTAKINGVFLYPQAKTFSPPECIPGSWTWNMHWNLGWNPARMMSWHSVRCLFLVFCTRLGTMAIWDPSATADTSPRQEFEQDTASCDIGSLQNDKSNKFHDNDGFLLATRWIIHQEVWLAIVCQSREVVEEFVPKKQEMKSVESKFAVQI